MIEKTKTINNPLTLFAIFAGISEISSTCAIGLVSNELQYIFIWFVIGFPILLLLLFFIILILKPRVLYSPSDFKDERNFLITMELLDKNSRKIKRNVVTQANDKK
ncbi:MAG TPA: hypothetical protein VF556_00380 [Pyrinomonadaceae bacterium]